MKVIQILPELNAGGVERGTLEVGKYLVKQGHKSIVISNGGRQVAQLEAEGSRHINRLPSSGQECPHSFSTLERGHSCPHFHTDKTSKL